MKILIADDDAISRRLTQKVLERAGYEVLAVENGISAAESLAGPDGPRLVLLDWVMASKCGSRRVSGTLIASGHGGRAYTQR